MDLVESVTTAVRYWYEELDRIESVLADGRNAQRTVLISIAEGKRVVPHNSRLLVLGIDPMQFLIPRVR